MNRILIAVAAVIAAMLVASTARQAQAQDYPSRPIHFIVPFPPGGGADLISRTAAQGIEAALKQPVVVENKGGAAGIIGTESIAKAAPDGYTIGLLLSAHAVNDSLYAKLPYKTVDDFTPITIMANGTYILLVHPSLNVETLPQLIALAKSRPGALNFGTIMGSLPHMAAELLRQMADIDIQQVSYKGTGPALNDLLGGHIQAMFASLPPAVPYIQEGRLKAIAVTTKSRSTVVPAVPTMVEAGLPGFELEEWFALGGPKGLPPNVVAKINTALKDWLRSPEIKERLVAVGMNPVASRDQEFEDLLKADTAKWAKVIKAANITPQ